MLLSLCLVLALAWIAGNGVSRLGYPPVLGELVAGVVFGPPLLGWLAPSQELAALSTLGVVLLMLFVGLKADPVEIGKAAPRALVPAVVGIVVPGALAGLAVVALAGGTPAQGVLVGAIAGITALATVSRVLVDLRMLDSELGRLLVSVSLIIIVLVLMIFAVALGVLTGDGGGVGAVGWVVGKAVLFLAAAVAVGVYGLEPLGERLRRVGLGERPGLFTFCALVMLAYAAASFAAGLSVVPGAFLAGLFLTRPVLAEGFDGVVDSVRDASVGFLTPVFFFTAGFAADLGFILREPLFVAALLAAAFGGKILAGMLGLIPARRPWREGVVLGVGMNGRGGTDVILAGLALSAGAIDDGLFTALVLTTVVTTLPVPILLQWGARWAAPTAARAATERSPA